MLFRILGAISIGLGAVFALLALLIFLPFLDNFNLSLLMLAGIFGILAWVLLAIGWQLVHPPEEAADVVEEGDLAQPGHVAPGPDETPPSEAAVGVPATDPATIPGGPETAAEQGSRAEEVGAARAAAPGEDREAADVAPAEPAEPPEPVETPPPMRHVRPEQTFVSLGGPDPTRASSREEAEGGGSAPGAAVPAGSGNSGAVEPASPESATEAGAAERTPADEAARREAAEQAEAERRRALGRGGRAGGRFKKPGSPVPPPRGRDED